MNYADMLIKNKNDLKIEVIVSIDNDTLRKTYSVYTNLHCDFGISDIMLNAGYYHSKSKFNRHIAQLKKLLGFKMKLSGTNNSVGYTRLIYTMQG